MKLHSPLPGRLLHRGLEIRPLDSEIRMSQRTSAPGAVSRTAVGNGFDSNFHRVLRAQEVTPLGLALELESQPGILHEAVNV